MSPHPTFTPSYPLPHPPTRTSPSPTPTSNSRRRTRVRTHHPARATIAPPIPPPSAPSTPSLEPEAFELCSPSDFQRLNQSATAAGHPLVVLFHAQHCRACKFVLPKFRTLASTVPNVAMATVLYSEARELSMRLGVARVPTVHVYQGKDGKVDDFACGLNSLEKLRSTVRSLDQGSRYRRADEPSN